MADDDGHDGSHDAPSPHLSRSSSPMFRIVAAIVLVAVLAVGGGIIATTAYQAGLSARRSPQAVTEGATVVTPVVVPRVRLRLAPVRLRLRVLRLPVHAVLPVHRVRAHPGDRLGRLGIAMAGADRAGAVDRAGTTSPPGPLRIEVRTARSRTGIARPTTRRPAPRPPADVRPADLVASSRLRPSRSQRPRASSPGGASVSPTPLRWPSCEPSSSSMTNPRSSSSPATTSSTRASRC